MAIYTQHAERRRAAARHLLLFTMILLLPARLRRMPQDAGGPGTGKTRAGKETDGREGEEEGKAERPVQGPPTGYDAPDHGIPRDLQAGPLGRPGLARRKGQSGRLPGRVADGRCRRPRQPQAAVGCGPLHNDQRAVRCPGQGTAQVAGIVHMGPARAEYRLGRFQIGGWRRGRFRRLIGK